MGLSPVVVVIKLFTFVTDGAKYAGVCVPIRLG
jgi:hypothetical protein